jgi:enolase-phosphatase E1
VKIVLLDVEGTTTPVDFVYRTLFGYARTNFRSFLENNQNDSNVQGYIEELKLQNAIDERESRTPPLWVSDSAPDEVASACKYALWLMDHDSKIGPLKALQGLVWQEGYRSGNLKGEVFPDIPRAFDRWRKQGKEIAIYSSGSELAQTLLFRTTTFGDLSLQIVAFFDTRVGAKTSTESYQRIAASAGYPPDCFLFLSDTSLELDAARRAGMQTGLVVRSETARIGSSQAHPTLKNFDCL